MYTSDKCIWIAVPRMGLPIVSVLGHIKSHLGLLGILGTRVSIYTIHPICVPHTTNTNTQFIDNVPTHRGLSPLKHMPTLITPLL